MLGDNIRLLRSVRGISQVELGEKLNVSKQSISNWENGNIQPSIEMLMKIADFFSVSTDFLFYTVLSQNGNYCYEKIDFFIPVNSF